MPSRSTFLCIPCRRVGKDSAYCPTCGEPMLNMGSRWRPPKKNNERAWKQIEQKRYLWDEAAVAKTAAKSPYQFWLMLTSGRVPRRMSKRNTIVRKDQKGVLIPPW